jgi:kelch-like protein 17 (actinfilin)
MKNVRLPLVAREFLTTAVDSEPLVRRDSECRELLPEQRASLSSSRTQQRKPDGARPYLFAVGGGSLFAIHSECESYNPRTDRWMPVAPMLYRRSRSGVTALGRLLYVVGGYVFKFSMPERSILIQKHGYEAF